MSTDKTNQSWGGRFSEPVDAFVARFTASVTFDQRLYRHDIMGSIAHATMLAKVGVLTDAERDSIIDGLKTIQGEIEAGEFDWRRRPGRRAHEHRGAADRRASAMPANACTPGAAATTRSRPISACGCATRSTVIGRR